MTNKILEVSPYQFWSKEINEYLSQYSNEYFLNLASKEFSKILDPKIFTKIIDIEFRQVVDKNLKNISTEAKKARGSLLNFIILNKIKTVEEIKKFNGLDYKFDEKLSTDTTFYFLKGESC